MTKLERKPRRNIQYKDLGKVPITLILGGVSDKRM